MQFYKGIQIAALLAALSAAGLAAPAPAAGSNALAARSPVDVPAVGYGSDNHYKVKPDVKSYGKDKKDDDSDCEDEDNHDPKHSDDDHYHNGKTVVIKKFRTTEIGVCFDYHGQTIYIGRDGKYFKHAKGGRFVQVYLKDVGCSLDNEALKQYQSKLWDSNKYLNGDYGDYSDSKSYGNSYDPAHYDNDHSYPKDKDHSYDPAHHKDHSYPKGNDHSYPTGNDHSYPKGNDHSHDPAHYDNDHSYPKGNDHSYDPAHYDNDRSYPKDKDGLYKTYGHGRKFNVKNWEARKFGGYPVKSFSYDGSWYSVDDDDNCYKFDGSKWVKLGYTLHIANKPKHTGISTAYGKYPTEGYKHHDNHPDHSDSDSDSEDDDEFCDRYSKVGYKASWFNYKWHNKVIKAWRWNNGIYTRDHNGHLYVLRHGRFHPLKKTVHINNAVDTGYSYDPHYEGSDRHGSNSDSDSDSDSEDDKKYDGKSKGKGGNAY
jgi:hypothetical protein